MHTLTTKTAGPLYGPATLTFHQTIPSFFAPSLSGFIAFTTPLTRVDRLNTFCPFFKFKRNSRGGRGPIVCGFALLLPETTSADPPEAGYSMQITCNHGDLAAHKTTRYTLKSNQKAVLLSYDKREASNVGR